MLCFVTGKLSTACVKGSVVKNVFEVDGICRCRARGPRVAWYCLRLFRVRARARSSTTPWPTTPTLVDSHRTRPRSPKAGASRSSPAACIATVTISPEPWWTTFPNLVRLVAPNISTVLPNYSDAQLATVLRKGVKPDGKSVLFMPSEMFRHLRGRRSGASHRLGAHQASCNRRHAPRRRSCDRSGGSSSPLATSSRRRSRSSHCPRRTAATTPTIR